MSITWKAPVTDKALAKFLAEEYKKETNIPVHLFSVVRAEFKAFNGVLGITDGQGTLFMEAGNIWKSYGAGNPIPMIDALRRCNCPVRAVG